MASNPTLEECPAAAGSINDPTNPDTPDVPSYVPPDLCIGENLISDPNCGYESSYQEQVAAENLNASGAILNVFKLLGIHEQGKLIDLTGNGQAIGTGQTDLAFDDLAPEWVSPETGADVTAGAWIGYDFGTKTTSYGQPDTSPATPVQQHITSFRITQGATAANRALQVRIDRSNGGYSIDPLKIQFTGTGNGGFGSFTPGVSAKPGTIMAMANSATSFTIIFTGSSGTEVLGIATVGQKFNSQIGSFIIQAGSIPFAAGDMFSAPIELQWFRVDVVNLPNIPTPALIRINQSSASRFWRIVPLSFAGVLTNEPWVVSKLELFDYQATRLDDVQDTFFQENRDRDYAKTSIQIKASYTPFDAMMDMSKFGFQVADIWTFNTSFAMMIAALGRPIVVGDVIEIPAELQWDHNMRPVRRFVEVSDVGWSSEGYTAAWKPIIYRFQAQQLIPSQEHRDLLGTVTTQKYTVDDSTLFAGLEQIQTNPLTATEANTQEAYAAAPESGFNIREQASGTNRFKTPGSYDGVGVKVEDGLPPDGQPYITAYDKLPPIQDATDGQFCRLERDPALNIPATLYKFSSVKLAWQYVETDRRNKRVSHKPSQLRMLEASSNQSLTKKIT